MVSSAGIGRLRGVDAARGVALVGMMAVHVLPAVDAAKSASAAHLVASGRASALFAVLAGVGIALTTGAAQPYRGRRLVAARGGLVARTVVLAFVGLALGAVDTPVAIILVYYALLFPCALPFLSLRPTTLAALAGGWALFAPILSQILRRSLPKRSGDNPTFRSLAEPQTLLQELFLTGYYPVLPWVAYLLAGLAAGRLVLRAAGVAAALLVGGTALAVMAKAVSWTLLHPIGGLDRIASAIPPGSGIDSRGLDVALSTSLYGTTPTTSWWWLAVSAPHSATPLDLLHTIGTALGVLGGCLLIVHVAAPLLAPLTAAGGMTLTLYTAHVAAIGTIRTNAEQSMVLLVHVSVALVVAMIWLSWFRRGPLEQAASMADRGARFLVSQRFSNGVSSWSTGA